MPDKAFYSRMGRLSAIITILPSAMGVGWIVGYYVIDQFLGTTPWGTILFVFVGAAAGFYQIVLLLMPRQYDSSSRKD